MFIYCIIVQSAEPFVHLRVNSVYICIPSHNVYSKAWNCPRYTNTCHIMEEIDEIKLFALASGLGNDKRKHMGWGQVVHDSFSHLYYFYQILMSCSLAWPEVANIYGARNLDEAKAVYISQTNLLTPTREKLGFLIILGHLLFDLFLSIHATHQFKNSFFYFKKKLVDSTPPHIFLKSLFMNDSLLIEYFVISSHNISSQVK